MLTRQQHHQRPWRPRDRSQLRAWLEVRGVIGGHRTPTERIILATDDGERTVGSLLAGPGDDAPAVLLAHGFAARRIKPAYAYLADRLAASAHVLAIDLRGHGASSGRCTLGDRERYDVAAGLRYLRLRYRSVVALGVSMGGTATVHALAEGGQADAVATISTPATIGRVGTPAMESLDRVWRTPWRRIGFELATGVRIVGPSNWDGMPHPRDLAAKIDLPLLVVHGDDDHYFPFSDAEELHAAAAGPATLWREPGFGHAEDGITTDFTARLRAAVAAVARDGRWPEREQVDGDAHP